jgi:hypothetical protein
MRTDMIQDRPFIANPEPFYAVTLVFRDESEPDVFGWAAINDFFSRRCPTVCFGRQAVLQQVDRLRKIMNVSIDRKGKLTQPDASISAETAADVDADHRDARPFNRVANGVLAQHRKVERIESEASSAAVVAEQVLPHQVATQEVIQTIAGALKRIADHFDPPPPDVVDSVYLRKKLGCTTQWIADMARSGVIPAACIVPGTGNGKPWKFYRSKIEKRLKER